MFIQINSNPIEFACTKKKIVQNVWSLNFDAMRIVEIWTALFERFNHFCVGMQSINKKTPTKTVCMYVI